MNKAIFLDRDGVINKEMGDYVSTLSEFHILPFVLPNLIKFAQAGFMLCVITNQGGIAKGLYTEQTLAQIHHLLQNQVKKAGLPELEIFYCPHHPDFGKCICRKPDSLLLEKAIARHQIDVSASWFIGDRQRDIDAAEKVGIRSILIESNTDWTSHADQIISAG